MASYVHKKQRAFRDVNTAELLPRRSEGRMKTYPSATDARAWCDETEERRQHIIELIRKDISKGVSLGKFVPIEVIIDTLLANKNADIEKLRQQLDELQQLLDMYEKLDLTEDQKRQLAGMKQGMRKAGAGLDQMAGTTTDDETAGDGTTTPYTTEEEEAAARARKAAEGGVGGAGGADGAGAGAARAGGAGAGGISGAGPGGAGAGGVGADGVGGGGAGVGADGARAAGAGGGAAGEADAVEEISIISAAPAALGSAPGSTAGAAGTGAPKYATKDDEIAALKQALADKEAECEKHKKVAKQAIEQLENIQDIVEERDRLRKQLQESKHELETLKKGAGGGSKADGGQQTGTQAQALEAEMESLRQRGELTPEQEVQLMKQQLEAVKQDCAKLASIQAENSRLKKELEALKGGATAAKGAGAADTDVGDDNDCVSLRRKLKAANDDLDKLRARCQQLENELLNYGDLPDEVEVLQERSKMLDSVISERDSLYKRLKELEGLEEQVKQLKKKADRADELEKQLAQLQQELQRESAARRSSDATAKDLERTGADMKNKAKEAEVLKVERDRMKLRLDELAGIEAEYMKLLDKTRGFDALKAERDMYKQKHQELLGLECECDILRAQLDQNRSVDKERDALQRQVRECECCIADQEDEIKRLVTHIDRLTNGRDDQQERTKEVIDNMRKELAEKDQLISSSEEQLAHVQDELKSTIENVSSETMRLKQRIEELEQLLREKDALLIQITEGKEQEDGEKDDLISKMREELEAAKAENEKLQDIAEQMASFAGDEHYKEMLVESKSAVEKVKEQLNYTYDQWDCMKGKIQESESIGESASDLFAKYTEERQKSTSLLTDIGKCNEKVKELEAQLREAQKLIAKLREQTGDMEQTSAENKALRRHSAEVQEVAKEQIEELVEHLRKAKEKIAELEAENDRLRRGLAATSRELETLESSAPDSDSLEKLRRELEEVQQEKAKLEAMIKSLQEGVSADDPGQELIRLKGEYAALEQQLQKEIALRQAAEDKVKELEARLASGTAGGDTEELEKLRKELANAQQEIDNLQARLLSERTQSEQRAAKLNMELDNLTDSVRDKTRRNTLEISELEAELVKLRAENKQLQSDLANVKPVSETAAKAVDTSELTALKEERDKLLKQIEDQNKEIANLLEQMKSGADAAAVAEIEKQKSEKAALQELIDKLQKQVKDLSTTPQVTDTSDLAVADTIKRMTQQLEEEERNAKELKEKHEKCQQELEKLRQQLREKTGQLSVSQLGADEKIRRLSEQVESGEAEAGSLKQQLDKCQAELQKLREQLREQKSQKNRLSISQLGSQQELKRLSEQFDTATGKCQEEIERLKQLLQQKQDELDIEKKKTSSAEGELKQLQDAMVGDDPDGAFKAMQNALKDVKAENENFQKEIAALKQRISGLEDENKKLKDQLGGAVTEVERTRRTSKEWERKYSESASVKEQYDRDTNNLHKKHEEAVAKLQEQHEQAMKELREELEKEINSLREQLRKCQGKGSVDKASLTSKTMEMVDIKPKRCTCGSKLERILQKALKNGLEALEFDELKFLHTKVCDATANIAGKPTGRRSSSRQQLPTMESEKLLLLQKINTLEKDLIRKQRQTQQKVAQLQIAVNIERERLEDLRKNLQMEKHRNGELLSKIGAQNKTVASMQMERELLRKQTNYHEEKLENLILAVEEERARMQALQQELKKEKGHVKKLKTALDEERAKGKKKDRELESMRIKYEKALNSEMLLKMELEEKPHQQQQAGDECDAPCALERISPQEDACCGVPVPEPMNTAETTTFYTELTIRDAQNRQNFIHNSILRRGERTVASSRRRSASGGQSTPRRSAEYDR